MARIKIERVLEHLDSDIIRALEETLKTHFPNVRFDEREVYRTFLRAVDRKCSTWERIPDHFVEKDL